VRSAKRFFGVAVVAATALALIVLLLTRQTPASAPPAVAERTAITAAQGFLDTYVDPDGRVVRRDQGGDTVSEGQAYAMLLAVAANDRSRFVTIWRWTQTNMQRPDGLLSWQWRAGQLVDRESAADADLDAARALVLAGQHFRDDALGAAGRAMASAVLNHETAQTPRGLVLTAGTWSTTAPWTVNPSYFSPAATAQLGAATGDPRWAQLQAGGTAVIRALLAQNPLPPDWAKLTSSGEVTPTQGPDGASPRFSLDAARVVLRTAESCTPADRTLAADAAVKLDKPVQDLRGMYSLDGNPTVDWKHPLVLAAAAAADTATGDAAGASAALDAAQQLDARSPGYYGAAWVALGRVLLQTNLLGSCTGKAP